ncbi:NYN domain-containing protein [Candidatus Gracilibacteria bacterium]|nr:NYN domain-containing protein [Candidatus Gracilibacteria bacterium]
MEERIYVYIDGGNFYQRIVNDYGFHYQSFKLSKFCNDLIGAGRKKEGIRYYVGKVKQYPDNPKSIQLYNSQQKLLQKLKDEEIYSVLGHIQKIGDTYREKGVDVRIGLDLLEGAYEDRYDTALVISSDSDLTPAFELVRRKGKKIESIMFDRRFSIALQKGASTFRILNKNDLIKFGSLK